MIITEDIIMNNKLKIFKQITQMNLRNLITTILIALVASVSFSQAGVRPTQITKVDAIETGKLTLKGGVFTGKAINLTYATAKNSLIPSALAVYNAIHAKVPYASPDTTTGVRSVAIFTGAGVGTDTATFVNAVNLTTREKVTIVTDTVNATVTTGNTGFKFATTQSTYTATLPASPVSGDVVYLMFETAVTTLTVGGNGKTIRGTALTSASVGTVASYLYVGGTIDKWFRRD